MRFSGTALAALIVVSAGVAGRAGDAASLDILGFRADGGVFAFEEYGIQDGSGFPYANRYYVDVEADDFVRGTPIRVRLDQDGADLQQARAQARMKGEVIVPETQLRANAGTTAGSNPLTERSSDPHRMVVMPRPFFPSTDDPLEFRIEETGTAQPPVCQNLGIAKGLRLTRIRAGQGGTTEIVHNDKAIPESRGCPLGYSIVAVQTFYPENGPPAFALIVGVRRVGFEGPDHRYIAITGRI